MADTNEFVRLSKWQKRIYEHAELETAYTFAQLAALASEFEADAVVKTPGALAQMSEIHMDAVQGLCEWGYFTPAVDPYGSELVLEDWTFTKVENPVSITLPVTVDWVIPFTVQGILLVGVAPTP